MNFAQQMSFYSAYHQERRNVWIHVVGVPLITFSLLVVMSWVELYEYNGFPITLALVFVVGTLIYYFMLDFVFALAATLVFGGLLIGAHFASQLGVAEGWAIFAAGQLLGWGTQFYGHYVFEKKKPALFDNLSQAIFSAPLFVVADVFFTLGLRKKLEHEVRQILAERGQLRPEYAETVPHTP